MASDVTWTRSGDFTQHVTGYRAQSLGFQFSSLGFLRYPYAVPALYGNRLALLFGRDTVRREGPPPRVGGRGAGPLPLRTAGERVSGPRNPQGVTFAVHPLATDRERVYRYSGGDTVESLRIGDRVIRIVKIDVTPKLPLPPRTTLFAGEIDLDMERKHVVRMRGSFGTTAERPSGPLRLLDVSQLEGAVFMELVNSEVNQDFWLPSYQRFEFQAMAATFGESKAVFRVVSRFRQYEISPPSEVVGARVTDSLRARPHLLTIAPTDSLATYSAWKEAIGELSRGASTEDFADVAPARWRPTGVPLVRVQTERFSDFVRFNRVEGIFTGAGVTAQLRDAAPGLTLRAAGGYAWQEATMRGRVSAELQRRVWTAGVRAGRSLDITNDFRSPLDSGNTLGALFGADDYDYVDRSSATLFGVRRTGERSTARLELGWAHDGLTVNHLNKSPLRNKLYRANRGIAPGDYLRTALVFDVNPDAAAELMRPGKSARLSYVRGDGGLRFQRVEITLGERYNIGRWSVAGRLDAGVVMGDPPPQQLFELGGPRSLPGYEYKQFGGDQAALARGVVMYRLKLLEAPIRLNQRFWLPPVAPTLAFSVQSGWTGLSGPLARASFAQLISGVTSGTSGVTSGSTGLAPTEPTATGSARTSVAFGLRFFGGAIGVNLARALDGSERWRLRMTFGQLF